VLEAHFLFLDLRADGNAPMVFLLPIQINFDYEAL